MKISQFEIWIAELNPKVGTEPGKTRPVLVLQTDLLNQISHPSILVCPLTSSIRESTILRVHIRQGTAGVKENCDVMIDQIRAIDNKRLIKRIGILPEESIENVKENIKIVLDLIE